MTVSGDKAISTPIEGALPEGIIHAVIVPESRTSVLHAVIQNVGETLKKTVVIEEISYKATSLGAIEKVETEERFSALMKSLPGEIGTDLTDITKKDLKSLEDDLNKSLDQIEKEFETSSKKLNDKIATLDKKDSFEQKDFDEIDGLLKEIKALKKELSKTQLEATSAKIAKLAKNIVTLKVYVDKTEFNNEKYSENFGELYKKFSRIQKKAEEKHNQHIEAFAGKLFESEAEYKTLQDEFAKLKDKEKDSQLYDPKNHFFLTNSLLRLVYGSQEATGVYTREKKLALPSSRASVLPPMSVDIAPKPALNLTELRAQLQKAEDIKAKIAVNNKTIAELEKKIELIEAKKDSIESAISKFNELKSQFDGKNSLLELQKQKTFPSTKALEADIKALKQEICDFLHKKIDGNPSNTEILFDKAFLEGVLEDSFFSGDEELKKIFNEKSLYEIPHQDVTVLENGALEDQNGNEVLNQTSDGVKHYYIKTDFLAQINAAFKDQNSVTTNNVQFLSKKTTHLNDLLIPILLDKIADLEGSIDELAVKNIELGEKKPFKVVNAPDYATYSATAAEKAAFNNLNDATISKTNQFVNLTRKTTQFLSSLIQNYKNHRFLAAHFITSITVKLKDLEITPNEKVLDAFKNAYTS